MSLLSPVKSSQFEPRKTMVMKDNSVSAFTMLKQEFKHRKSVSQLMGPTKDYMAEQLALKAAMEGKPILRP